MTGLDPVSRRWRGGNHGQPHRNGPPRHSPHPRAGRPCAAAYNPWGVADHLLASCELSVADFAAASKTAAHMYHLLYSGGGLTKDEKADKEFWQAATIQRIYREWPILSLLGASYNGNMLQGKLSVGQGYPLATRLLSRFFPDPETAYALFPAHHWIDIHPASLIQGRSVEDL